MKTKVSLSELASVIRSKNAGPFLVTLDVIFDDRISYARVRDSDLFAADHIRKLYGLSNSWPVEIFFDDGAYAIKVTMPNQAPSGHFLCTDVYGAQQYFPLLELTIEVEDSDH